MIIKFDEFLNEVRVSDGFKNINNAEILNKYQNQKFDNDENLIEYVILSGEKFSNKIIKIK